MENTIQKSKGVPKWWADKFSGPFTECTAETCKTCVGSWHRISHQRSEIRMEFKSAIHQLICGQLSLQQQLRNSLEYIELGQPAGNQIQNLFEHSLSGTGQLVCGAESRVGNLQEDVILIPSSKRCLLAVMLLLLCTPMFQNVLMSYFPWHVSGKMLLVLLW